MKIQGKTAVLLSACLIAGNIFSVSVQAKDTAAQNSSKSRYKMAAVIDRARGNTVLAGDYERAIEALSGKSVRRFASSTNLCVAYTMTGELQKADIECGAALTLSQGNAAERDIAIAFSNLGVLKAVSGDLSGAQDDFNRALELNRKIRQASDNLQILRDAHASGA